jgi:Immunoglobulin I-set domain
MKRPLLLLITFSTGQLTMLIGSFFFSVLQVSWIRKRDLHILTFGPVSYTNDARFSVVKSASGDTWTLRIRTVQLRDAGMYECQVSSEPKISRAVRLKVVGE